jgi:hypothetical protein
MRIVVTASDDGERTVAVYDNACHKRVASFDIGEDERAELQVAPVLDGNITPGTSPRDAGEVWADVELDEYRVLGQ